MARPRRLPPIHPGQALKTVLDDAGLTANAVALALRVPANRLSAIVNGKRSITAGTAMRLGRYFGTSAQMWINMQARYDLEIAEDELAETIRSEVAPLRKSA